MNSSSWLAGDRPAAITPAGVVVLAPGNEKLARHFWTLLTEGTTFAALVQVLTTEFGADLTALPEFAMILHEADGERVAVRGSFAVRLRADGRESTIDGGSLITWSERQLSNIEAWTIAVTANALNEEVVEYTGMVRDAVIPVSRLSTGAWEETPSHEDSANEEHAPVAVAASDEQGGEDSQVAGGTDEALPERGEPDADQAEASCDEAVEDQQDAKDPSESTAKALHDGRTVNLTLANARPSTVHVIDREGEEGNEANAPKVLAVPCVDGHPNPPYMQSCRVCGKEMSRTLARVNRPSLGRLVMSSGEVVELDRDIIFGRNPKELYRASRPDVRLVSVDSHDQEISRTHCEIRVDGWDARVRDLGSQNGTFVTHAGKEPERVDQATPVILRCGDVITLANSVSMRLEC